MNLSVLQTYEVDLHVHLGPALPSSLPSPDVYFTQEYGRAASVSENGEWVLLEAFDGAWQLPLIVRTLVDGTKDAVSPYGYSGVFASPSLSGEQVQQAWSATVSCLRDLGVISLLLRHSPLVSQASDLSPLPGLRSVVSGHPTVVVEPADSASAWSGLEKHCRNKVRKATKNGYTGIVRPAEHQDLMTGGTFRSLYEQTMDRLDAAAIYDFSDAYYRALLDGLGSSLLIAQVRDQRGVVVSCNLLMRHAERLHSHLSCSSREDARMGSNNLLKWTSIEFAIEQGLSQFHLGGGLDARDSLFSFKNSFGGRELEYRVSGLVTDDQLYQAQVERRAKELDTTSEALLTSSYFPAYRGGTP